MGIYIDVYFFLNFAVDFFALFSVEKLLFLPESRLKCFLGALLGGIYSVLCLFFTPPAAVHPIAAAACVYTVVYKKKLIYLPIGLFLFLSAEAFIGGCITALKSFSESSLVLASVIIIICVCGSELYGTVQTLLRRRLETVGLTARLCHRGRCSELLLMIDSGNLVRDAGTGRRVIFVNADAIEYSTGDTGTLFERERCYVIPIRTASGEGRVMGFIPDKIEFSDKRYNREVFIVVPDTESRGFGRYDGIAPLI